MAENLVTKILREHMVDGSLEPGEEVGLSLGAWSAGYVLPRRTSGRSRELGVPEP